MEIVVDTRAHPHWTRNSRAFGAELESDPDFAAESAVVEEGEDLTIVSVALNAEGSSEEASAAIDRLRDDYVPEAFAGDADRVLVGGLPAENRDFFALIGNWLPIVIAFVLALTLVLLTLAFRSIVIALTAIAVNLLSVGAAYGLLVLVFQEGVATDLLGFGQVDRIEAWVPVFLFSVLFGLSMDYQVFLLSRIRERYTATGDTTEAIVFGVGSTARLITGAALIIIVVFAGFAAGELVSFQQMGFGVAIALLIDATIVRLVVIPAAMQLLGERNWYLPSWLEWLPHVEIEDPALSSVSLSAARRRTRQQWADERAHPYRGVGCDQQVPGRCLGCDRRLLVRPSVAKRTAGDDPGSGRSGGVGDEGPRGGAILGTRVRRRHRGHPVRSRRLVPL